ncbi:nucleotidyltransferase domain-containing protein [Candidatus Woesearchaeota archaeon]|nr:nucleotidyltransferase domain-containing protein [Candidatus Woesearchaeota archaeon]
MQPKYPSTVPLFPKIATLCKQVEKEQNIKILFAIENGSRAWRMESENSDYDVRFVFVRPIEDYFCLKTKQDVIELYFDKECKPCPVKENYIDMVGFDIQKFVRLLAKSNPTAIEWLITDITYHGQQNKVLKNFAEKNFNPISLIYHYQSLCNQNYTKYIKSGNLVSFKKYLYAFRGLVNALFVKRFNKIPPIAFNETFTTKSLLPDRVLQKIQEIITLKKQGKEKEIISHIPLFDNYIEGFLKEPIAKEEPKERHILELEKEIKRIILGK